MSFRELKTTFGSSGLAGGKKIEFNSKYFSGAGKSVTLVITPNKKLIRGIYAVFRVA